MEMREPQVHFEHGIVFVKIPLGDDSTRVHQRLTANRIIRITLVAPNPERVTLVSRSEAAGVVNATGEWLCRRMVIATSWLSAQGYQRLYALCVDRASSASQSSL